MTVMLPDDTPAVGGSLVCVRVSILYKQLEHGDNAQAETQRGA